jgi:adenylate cyclase
MTNLTDRIDRRLAQPGDDETKRAQKRLGLIVLFLAGIITMIFGYFDLGTPLDELGRHYIRLGAFMIALTAGLWAVPRSWPLFVAVILLVATVEPLYPHLLTGGYTLGTMEITWAIIGPILAVLIASRRVVLIFILICLGVLITGAILDPIAVERAPTIPYEDRVFRIVNNLGVLIVFVSGGLLFLFRQLDNARRRADDLLLNILPAPITERLKAAPVTIADGFDEATVLFADIVDFTTMSAKADPIEVVGKLNEVFSEFDELAQSHGLEKIKTIGDAYMVAAGLPDHRPDHVEAMVDFARVMLAAANRHTSWSGESIRLRVGINTGPVVAGVIGRHKFIYDLWGDAVNVASRMESNGLANQIQVTQAVRDRLDGRYTFEPRGPVEIKGKGLMMTYILSDE